MHEDLSVLILTNKWNVSIAHVEFPSCGKIYIYLWYLFFLDRNWVKITEIVKSMLLPGSASLIDMLHEKYVFFMKHVCQARWARHRVSDNYFSVDSEEFF